MFCNNCGEKINENLMFCPACGNKLTEQETNVEEKENIVIDVAKVKKKFMCIVIILIVAVAANTYFKSSAGKLAMSQILLSMKQYSKAHDMVSGIDTEKADAYEQYSLLLMHEDYLRNRVVQGELGDTIARIRGALSMLDDRRYMLKDSEKTVVSNIETALNNYDSEFENIMEFKDDINMADNVYNQFEIFSKGEKFDPNRVKSTAESWQKALDEANSYYISITGTIGQIEGYEAVSNDIKYVQDEMDRAIGEYGENSSVWYTNGFKYGQDKISPYNSETIDKLVYNIEKALVDKYFVEGTN